MSNYDLTATNCEAVSPRSYIFPQFGSSCQQDRQQPPFFSPSHLDKTIFITRPVPSPSIYSALTPSLPSSSSIHQSQVVGQSHSGPLTSPINVYRWIFSCFLCFWRCSNGGGVNRRELAPVHSNALAIFTTCVCTCLNLSTRCTPSPALASNNSSRTVSIQPACAC